MRPGNLNSNSTPLPLVSVLCQAYNHEKFIQQCLDGIVMQKTSFPYEALVHDDASTDGTADIIRKYEADYPGIIKPVYQSENQYSQKKKVFSRIQLSRAAGRYVAVCEGDDYWIDPLKLQKQADFMESNDDCSICFHATKHVKDGNAGKYTVCKPKNIAPDNKYETKHAIAYGGSFVDTCSIMFRRELILDRPSWMDLSSADLTLLLHLSTKGKIGYIDEIMSVYRTHVANSWSQRLIHSPGKRIEHSNRQNEMWAAFNEANNYQYDPYVQEAMKRNAGIIRRAKIMAALNKNFIGRHVVKMMLKFRSM